MSLCSRCGAPFCCAMVELDRVDPDRVDADRVDPGSDEPCWCTLLPALVPLPAAPGSACWCAACLKRRIAAHEAKPAAE